VVNVAIPPLRERREELPALIEHLLHRAAARYSRPVPALSARLLRGLERHAFPGNVRELENLLKRIVVLGSEDRVLRELLGGEARGADNRRSFERLLEEVEETAGELSLREVGRRASIEAERGAIERALYQTRWNRKQAARLLGVSYKTLLLKIRECGLEE
jgi:two-component system response regulator AtoC